MQLQNENAKYQSTSFQNLFKIAVQMFQIGLFLFQIYFQQGYKISKKTAIQRPKSFKFCQIFKSAVTPLPGALKSLYAITERFLNLNPISVYS